MRTGIIVNVGDIGLLVPEGDTEYNVALAPIVVLANLYGVVTDAETGSPLSGVKVTIDSSVTYTDASGNYRFEGLNPRTYEARFERAGYETAAGNVTLGGGANILNASLTPIPPPVANLYGVVTDAETGSPIPGVKVTIDSLVTYTDASGNYGFTGLTPGGYTITFEKEGYETLVR